MNIIYYILLIGIFLYVLQMVTVQQIFQHGGNKEIVALPIDETYTTQYLYPNGYWPLYYFNKYNYFPGPPYNYGCPTCFDAPFA